MKLVSRDILPFQLFPPNYLELGLCTAYMIITQVVLRYAK